MNSISKILIGFIAYNPDINSFRQKIFSIPEEFKIIVIDNSEDFLLGDDIFLHSNICVRKMKSNVGAAGGARMLSYYALKKRFDFVVFFDQDTQFDIRRLETAISILNKSKYGICYAYTKDPAIGLKIDRPIAQTTGIFSGTILKLSTLKKVGLYNSSFFMEGFDLDYSLRCNENQILSCRIPVWKIEQQFGSGREIIFAGRKINLDDHAPWRYYYRGKAIVRIIIKHGLLQKQIVFKIIKSHFKMLAKIILFESEKNKKIFAYLCGICSKKYKF